MVIRTQDYSAHRQNELSAPSTAHVVIQEEIDSREDANVHTVRTKDDADGADTHHDAREEGRNKYFSRERKKKDKADALDNGIIVAKHSGGFNITV